MNYLFHLIILAGILISPTRADTIVLKTGKKYEGKVISENATSYLVEIQVTKSIKDERRFLKDNVEEILKESNVDKDFKMLGKLVPVPDQTDAKRYELIIKNVQDFLAKHPKSAQAKNVQAALTVLEKEYTIISKGGIKLNGQLITASEIDANAYDIHAHIIGKKMKQLASQGSYQPALRQWEILKRDYAHSTAYIDSLPLASRILQSYLKQLKEYTKDLDARKAKRASVLKSLNENDRDRAEQNIAQKQAAYEKLIEKEEKELRTSWLTIDLFHKKALDYNLRSTESELKRITGLDTSKITMAGPNYRGALAALADDKLKEAAKLISSLRNFKMPKKYSSPLMAQLEEKQAAQKLAMEKAAAEKAEQARLTKVAAAKAKADAKEAAAEAKKSKKSKKKKAIAK